MSDSTPLLNLPFIMAAQAQKHVTHNDALLGLDALVQPSVLSRAVADPPATPQEGDRYLIAAPATGDWAGMEGSIGAFQDAVWQFHSPMAGWRIWIADEARFLVYDGTQWRGTIADADLQNLAGLGINTAADATNKLAVKSPAVLFDNNGSDSQVKVNKVTAGDTASHLFQTNYSGRAEFGLTGDDDFHAKVSPDGSAWYDGLLIDKNTGVVTFPNGIGEKGSWTPTANFATPGDFVPSYNAQNGAYLCVGDLVHVYFDLDFDSNAYTSVGGYFFIDGLPFASVTDAAQIFFPVGVPLISNVSYASANLGPVASLQTAHTFIRYFLDNSGASSGNMGTAQVPASTTGISFTQSFFYRKG